MLSTKWSASIIIPQTTTVLLDIDMNRGTVRQKKTWKRKTFFLNIRIHIQYIPRYMHTVFALLCFVVVIHWLIFPYPSGLLHWHCGNLTIAPVPAKQPWWIWINTSCEFIMNDCIATTKQSTTKPCAYFLGYTVHEEFHPVDLGHSPSYTHPSYPKPSKIQLILARCLD